MVKLPRPTGKQMVSFLQRQGFTVVRILGSHYVLHHTDRWTTVPVHGNATLKIGTLRKILRDVGIDPVDFARDWHA